MLDLRQLGEETKQVILQEFTAYQQGDLNSIDRIDRLLQEHFVKKNG